MKWKKEPFLGEVRMDADEINRAIDNIEKKLGKRTGCERVPLAEPLKEVIHEVLHFSPTTLQEEAMHWIKEKGIKTKREYFGGKRKVDRTENLVERIIQEWDTLAEENIIDWAMEEGCFGSDENEEE